MTKLMSVAAGLAVGYFIYQYYMSSSRQTTHGRLDRKSVV